MTYQEEIQNQVDYAEYLDRQQPEPTAADYCAATGHAYYGDQYPGEPTGNGGRCYCGEITYPTGGPPSPLLKEGG